MKKIISNKKKYEHSMWNRNMVFNEWNWIPLEFGTWWQVENKLCAPHEIQGNHQEPVDFLALN